jgi:hypothetical protein
MASNRAEATTDKAQANAIQRNLITVAAGQMPVAVIGNSVVALFCVAILWSAVPPAGLLTWLAVMGVLNVARLRICAQARRVAPSADAAWMTRHVRRFSVLAAMTGLLWGVLGSVQVPLADDEMRAFATPIVVSMAAAAVTSHVALPAAGRVYVIAAVLPLSISYLLGPPTRPHIALGIL